MDFFTFQDIVSDIAKMQEQSSNFYVLKTYNKELKLIDGIQI